MDLDWKSLSTLMFMKDNSSMVNFMVKGYINGRMEVFMKDSLLLERDKEKEHGNHIMEMYLKEIILMISSMDGVSLLGKMDKSIKDNFQTIFVMALVNTNIQMVNLANIFGKMVILIIVYKTKIKMRIGSKSCQVYKWKINSLLNSNEVMIIIILFKRIYLY